MANEKMDSIKTPDLKNLDKKQYDNINTFDRYSRAEDPAGRVRVSFDNATHMKEIDSILAQKHEKKDEVEQMLEDFQPKRRPARATNVLDQGVKIHGKYVARRRILTAVIILLILVVCFALFAPPFFKANDTESGCRREDIFEQKGVTGYKADIMKDTSVYNLEALSSEKSDSYRICTVAFEANNMTPFTTVIDDYTISGGGLYKDHVVYSTGVGDSKEIPAFSKKTVKVEILVNRSGLTDDQFDQAVTSLKLSTRNTRKLVGKNAYIPCLPGTMNVSDVISFDPSK